MFDSKVSPLTARLEEADGVFVAAETNGLEHLGVGREQGLRQPVNVLVAPLQVRALEVVAKERAGLVARANVSLTTKRRNQDRVCVEHRIVVGQAAVPEILDCDNELKDVFAVSSSSTVLPFL